MISRTLANAAFILVIVGGSASAGPPDIFHGQTWEFMKTVGGVAIDTPSRTPQGSVYLPVICDVSGLTTVTQEPTASNPAMVVTGIDTRVDGRQILISVGTGLPSETTTSACQGVDLGDIPAGDYQVFYYNTGQEKHLLGEVIVPSH